MPELPPFTLLLLFFERNKWRWRWRYRYRYRRYFGSEISISYRYRSRRYRATCICMYCLEGPLSSRPSQADALVTISFDHSSCGCFMFWHLHVARLLHIVEPLRFFNVHLFNKKLSCRRETARCFVSLNNSLSHSKVIRSDTFEYGVCKSILVSLCCTQITRDLLKIQAIKLFGPSCSFTRQHVSSWTEWTVAVFRLFSHHSWSSLPTPEHQNVQTVWASSMVWAALTGTIRRIWHISKGTTNSSPKIATLWRFDSQTVADPGGGQTVIPLLRVSIWCSPLTNIKIGKDTQRQDTWTLNSALPNAPKRRSQRSPDPCLVGDGILLLRIPPLGDYGPSIHSPSSFFKLLAPQQCP